MSPAPVHDCACNRCLRARLAEAEALLRESFDALTSTEDNCIAFNRLRGNIDAFLAPDSASACEHGNPEPWKLADGRAGWRCESCGAEFRLTDDGAITMNADQPGAANGD